MKKNYLNYFILLILLSLVSLVSACGENGCDGYPLTTWTGIFLLSVKILLFVFIGFVIYDFIKKRKSKRKK